MSTMTVDAVAVEVGEVVPGRHLFRRMGWGRAIALSSVALITLIALFAPLLAPHNPLVPVGQPLQSPSAHAWFGTDSAGRDVFSRCLYGLRTSWFAALAVIAWGLLFGGTIGVVAGALGGWVDNLLMRITDLFLALPAPIMAIAVVAAIGPSLQHTLIAIAVVWWPYYARIVRAEVRQLAARPYMEAARIARIGTARVWFRHLLPGAAPTILVAASLDVGALIVTLAGLSFIGLGAPQPAPELGSMSAAGIPVLLSAWWVSVAPGAAVFLLAFCANQAGDALRTLYVDR
jgi:peptide/nickel transport system permease protein